MEALKQMILEQGKGIGSDIVKVDMFLNHRIDTKLLFAMGEAWAEEFRDKKPDLVLTVEASGIAMAVAAAHALGEEDGAAGGFLLHPLGLGGADAVLAGEGAAQLDGDVEHLVDGE